ncbi:response regulator transcription factor [Elizabethkingia meningoseptica]|nr:DNA-binding response regulator [Elizabethkingia meningoseptica]EOR28538.1 LuxR family transcriptional regulator [Elizabethkingia meningoseptica ATCC 13253 = NBRC 12535]AQX48657.1 LuxR family transcriptional regulator [Elizabethkingia meningoseptica]EJK5328226.1 response regulator transcription factor [Elizabethkingia meningoseptica]KUY13711.1 LuxR family transcriptional regulator [Elizabethkingia meningoseptica]
MKMEQQTEDRAIKFLLADDHSIVRQGMEITINEYVPNAKILHTSTLQQVVELLKTEDIEIAIIDAHFPDGNSLSILPELKSIRPDIRILIFSGLEEQLHALKFINAGANGYLSKLSEEDEVKEAVMSMVNYGKYVSDVVQELLVQYANDPNSVNPLSDLTRRELQIAELYAEGLGNLEIANQLDIKQNTVSTIKKNIFDKLNISNLVELIELIKTHHKI